MNITDQALKRLMTGCEAEWKASPRLLARATEIIESLAKQLEAKGDCTEEYNRGYKDGAREATELRDINMEAFKNMPSPIGKAEILNFGGHRTTLKDTFCKVDFKRCNQCVYACIDQVDEPCNDCHNYSNFKLKGE